MKLRTRPLEKFPSANRVKSLDKNKLNLLVLLRFFNLQKVKVYKNLTEFQKTGTTYLRLKRLFGCSNKLKINSYRSFKQR